MGDIVGRNCWLVLLYDGIVAMGHMLFRCRDKVRQFGVSMVDTVVFSGEIEEVTIVWSISLCGGMIIIGCLVLCYCDGLR